MRRPDTGGEPADLGEQVDHRRSVLPAAIRVPAQVEVVGAIHRLKIHQRVTGEFVDQALDLAEPEWRFV